MTTDPEMDTDTTEMEMETELEMATEPEMAIDTTTEMEMATDMATKMDMATDTTDNGYNDGNDYRGRNGKIPVSRKELCVIPLIQRGQWHLATKNNNPF